ncbi:MAG: hypothetical protein WCK75_07225 [Elusimicrobiota bacterium]
MISILWFAGPAGGLERKTVVGHTVAATPALAFVAAQASGEELSSAFGGLHSGGFC